MNRTAREYYNRYLGAVAQKYGVENTTTQFSATEPREQELNGAIQESNGFLSQITIKPVDELIGEIDTMTMHSTVSGRTDTTGSGERQPQVAGDPTKREYRCYQTDVDVALLYSTLNTWTASFPEFVRLYKESVVHRWGLDRMLIGFYGEAAAATTNRTENPLLQDVNFGWIYDLKTNKEENYIKGGNVGTEEAPVYQLTIGAGGDYINLDQVVNDLKKQIPQHLRTGREIAIIGEDLVADDTNKVLASYGQQPSEKIHFDILEKSYGGMRSTVIPLFPARGIMVTDPKNLEIRWQKKSLRRQTEDEPKKNRIVDYNCQAEAYNINQLDACVYLEGNNVKFTSELEG